MTRKYTLKEPRFDPFKNIYIGVDSIIKVCTNIDCRESRKPLNYDNWAKNSHREYGHKSQCRQCGYDYHAKRKAA